MANIINIAGAGREFSYNQSYQKSQSDVLNNPNQYGLYTADQYQAKVNEYNRGVTDGRNDVIDHPNNYALFTESQFNNHDIPRRIGFKWRTETFYSGFISYPENIKERDYRYILQIYVDGSLVKEGSGLYDMNKQDRTEPGISDGGETYETSYKNYKDGVIDVTINV